MTTYISMLRGINVGRHNLIKMDALRKLYEDLGFQNVATYLQSGNVVFKRDYRKQKARRRRNMLFKKYYLSLLSRWLRKNKTD